MSHVVDITLNGPYCTVTTADKNDIRFRYTSCLFKMLGVECCQKELLISAERTRMSLDGWVRVDSGVLPRHDSCTWNIYLPQC